MQNLCTENPQSSAEEMEENMLRNSDDNGGIDLENLLKQRTFTRQVSGIAVQDLGVKRPLLCHTQC